MQLQQGQMQLRDKEIGVVPGVADQRQALRVARQIARLAAVVRADQEQVVVILIIQVGLAGHSGPVNTLQIETWRAEIAPDLLVALEWLAVVSDVVGDELTKEGPASRDARVIGAGASRPLGRDVHRAAYRAERQGSFNRHLQPWQITEQAPKHPLAVQVELGPPGGSQTMYVKRHLYTPPCLCSSRKRLPDRPPYDTTCAPAQDAIYQALRDAAQSGDHNRQHAVAEYLDPAGVRHLSFLQRNYVRDKLFGHHGLLPAPDPIATGWTWP